MRFSSRSKAAALLLLVSLQYTFAAVDVALCSSGALCFPKGTGALYSKVQKACPQDYELTKDASGKEVCGRKVAVPCPAGTELNAAGKCCGKITAKKCVDQSGGGCPAGLSAERDCSMSGHPHIAGRRLLDTDNPVVKEVNIVGTTYVPNVILPKPAISFNFAPPPKRDPPKINIPSLQIPQIILPEPPVSITVPKLPKFGPDVKFEGNPSLLPNIIPILPEPLVTLEMPKEGFPSKIPKINTQLTQKVLNIDLSKVGPKNTVDVNLPAVPDIKGELLRLPDIDVNVPKGPAVVDLSALGPKHQFNVTLPELKLPKQGSITIVNNHANTPQYLDLTGFAPHNKSSINIKLPNIKTNGATVNVILDEPHNHTDIVIPGHGNTHHTTINVPAPHETPQKNAKLVLDIKANPALQDHLSGASHKKTNFTKIDIKMPDIDLSKALPGHPDIVVDVKPLLHLPEGGLTTSIMPQKKTMTKVDVKIPDVEIPRVMPDKTIVIKHQPIEALTAFIPKDLLNRPENRMNTTETVINLPNNTLKAIPVPAGKTNVAVSLPLKLGLARNLSNPAEPDATIDFMYQEEWTGGNPILPNPSAAVANAVGAVVDTVTSVSCPLRCCGEVTEATCKDQEFTLDVKPVEITCDKGCTYDLKADQCLCAGATQDACPAGMSKCSLGGKGVCVPALDGKIGVDACGVLKATCAVPGIVAKSCQ